MDRIYYSKTFRIREKYDFLRCPCPDDFNAAWLYDLTWYKNNDEGYLSEIPIHYGI